MRLAVVLLIASLAPAHAALTVCNHTGRDVRVALGRTNGASWLSQGWWTVSPKGCQIVLPGGLSARFYYLYAMDGSSGSWDGTHGFCVAPQDRFEIVGRGNCTAHGFERKGFFEIDTGSSADYTQTLSD
ncbi:MAG: DUF1036 domain-containing protein [Rhizomicrobium sp.]|jgi:uncharacterized membrane protein